MRLKLKIKNKDWLSDCMHMEGGQEKYHKKINISSYIGRRGGYYGIPFTFLKIALLVFNKNSQNHDECIV